MRKKVLRTKECG